MHNQKGKMKQEKEPNILWAYIVVLVYGIVGLALHGAIVFGIYYLIGMWLP